MRGKTLLALIVVLAVLFGLSQLNRHHNGKTHSAELKAGDRLFESLDVNAVERMTLQQGSNSVTLAKTEGRWTVEERFNYPADFNKLADLLRSLPERKAGELIVNAEPLLDEYGLLDGGSNPPVHLSLQDAGGADLLNIALGASRQSSGPYGMPGQGQFVQLDGGAVVLLDEGLRGAVTDPNQWIDRNLINLAETNVASMTVTLADASYTLTVNGPGDYALEGLAENETLKSYEPGRVVRSVQNLQIASIADPEKDDSGYGLWEGGRLIVTLRDGRSYTFSVGEKTPDGNNRYLNIKADFTPGPGPSLDTIAAAVTEEQINAAGDEKLDEKALSAAIEAAYRDALDVYQAASDGMRSRVEEESAQFEAWTFEVMNSTAESMITPREDLVDVKEEEGVSDSE